VASEVSPWAKTGGLADVSSALPEALAHLGHTVTTVCPLYRGPAVPDSRRIDVAVALGSVHYAAVLHVVTLAERRRIVFIDIPALFDRPGLYGTGGQDFADNADRFAVFAAAVLEFVVADPDPLPIDVIHAHDWQAALVPVLARTDERYRAAVGRAALVLTIHNLAFQGVFDRDVVPRFGLPWTVFRLDTGEYWGRFSFLKGKVVKHWD